MAAFKFRLVNNQAIADLAIDGQPPLKFLIDSGTFSFEVPDETAERLHWKQVGTKMTYGVIGGGIARVYAVDEIVIGNTFRLRNQLILSHARPDASDRFVGLFPPLSLGQSLMTFADRSFLAGGIRQKPPSDIKLIQCVPGGAQRPDSLIVRAKLDGQPVRLLVDTGARDGLVLLANHVHDRRLWDHWGTGNPISYEGVTGGGHGRLVQGNQLEIEGFVLNAPPIVLQNPAAWTHRDTLFDGIIGMEFLRRFDLWFDIKANQLGLRQNAMFDEFYRQDRSGIDANYPQAGGDYPVITALSPDGAGAKAGLRVGDQITGFSGGGSDLDSLVWSLSGPPGSTVGIRITRPDGDQTIKVLLQDLK